MIAFHQRPIDVLKRNRIKKYIYIYILKKSCKRYKLRVENRFLMIFETSPWSSTAITWRGRSGMRFGARLCFVCTRSPERTVWCFITQHFTFRSLFRGFPPFSFFRQALDRAVWHFAAAFIRSAVDCGPSVHEVSRKRDTWTWLYTCRVSSNHIISLVDFAMMLARCKYLFHSISWKYGGKSRI